MTETRAALAPAEARELFRAGTAVPTTGWCLGRTQANMISVPAGWAADFARFAELNPASCPVLEQTAPGARTSVLAPGADLTTDLPRYRVWQDGEWEEHSEVGAYWREDLVTFLIGCSFTFESALLDAGIPLRHIAEARNVAMYRTTEQCVPAGRLHGPMVVSMRPIPWELVATAEVITSRMPAVHGAPVAVGRPGDLGNARLGIPDLSRPDFGDPIEIAPGEVPVFWACGVTPQSALMSSRPPFAITHAPGFMFITDKFDRDYLLGEQD
ncbi:putative hydro-lyase [Streptomyces sp. ISL-94]|uniref:putative hydro-lyase n=1 Tax=Streptomyces sp. ISL-94 TaxID=2819190 RepID=UPI001BE73283|nr:putative hydro-lyase [Streptomyces sp. ISL-94]MBT2477183.1 putative hydro-lyase [Streptomyces sp. ISL-94]